MGGPFVAQCIHQTPVYYRQVGLLERHFIKDNIRVAPAGFSPLVPIFNQPKNEADVLATF